MPASPANRRPEPKLLFRTPRRRATLSPQTRHNGYARLPSAHRPRTAIIVRRECADVPELRASATPHPAVQDRDPRMLAAEPHQQTRGGIDVPHHGMRVSLGPDPFLLLLPAAAERPRGRFPVCLTGSFLRDAERRFGRRMT